MKPWLAFALVVVVASNAAALWRARANRQGEPESRLTLSSREVFVNTHGSDNSGASVMLKYETLPAPEAIGLNCAEKNPEEDRAAFAALELDGPGFAKLAPIQGPYNSQRPRLVVVAVAYDPAALRARYPDRTRVMILPATLYRFGTCMVRKLHGSDIHLTREQAARVEGTDKIHATIAIGSRYEPWVEDASPE